MSFQCTICHKKSMSGNAISHSKRHTKRKFKPNLQKINILVSGRKQKVYVCTQWIQAGKITKAG